MLSGGLLDNFKLNKKTKIKFHESKKPWQEIALSMTHAFVAADVGLFFVPI